MHGLVQLMVEGLGRWYTPEESNVQPVRTVVEVF